MIYVLIAIAWAFSTMVILPCLLLLAVELLARFDSRS